MQSSPSTELHYLHLVNKKKKNLRLGLWKNTKWNLAKHKMDMNLLGVIERVTQNCNKYEGETK
jgi:hypothetical protein